MAGTPERPQWKRNLRDMNWVNYSADLAESLRDFPKAIDDVPTFEAASLRSVQKLALAENDTLCVLGA